MSGADLPPDMDQLNHARELCGRSDALHAKLDALLDTKPTRGQVEAFMTYLNTTGLKEELEANILRICESVGIASPTGSEKLLALQIGLLQEQNAALVSLAKKTDQVAANAKQQPSIFGPVLAAILIGKAL